MMNRFSDEVKKAAVEKDILWFETTYPHIAAIFCAAINGAVEKGHFGTQVEIDYDEKVNWKARNYLRSLGYSVEEIGRLQWTYRENNSMSEIKATNEYPLKIRLHISWDGAPRWQ